MKVYCEVVRDLLPLYAEKIASKESANLVEEHLVDCQPCRMQYELMKPPLHTVADMNDENDHALHAVRKELKNRKTTAVWFASLVLLLVLVTVFAQITSPHYPDFTKGLITISEKADGTVYASFSDEVTAYHAVVQKDDAEYGKDVMLIEAWSTVWDRIVGKSAQIVQISSPEKPVELALYCANEKEAVAIYGSLPFGSGMILLPRLALGLYVYLAVIMAVILGVLWLILRKKPVAERIIRYCALAPVSYIVGHVCVKGLSTVSFSILRDFGVILIVSIVIYSVLCLGILLIKQKRKERINIR
jgi:hypothetical protein